MNTIKKIIGIVILVLCYSCANNEVESLFDKNPEERIKDAKQQLNKILVDAPHGWKTYFGTSDKVGRWLILMDFDKDGTVQLKCDPVDYYYLKGVKYDEKVSYKINFSQSSELVFESFTQFSAWNEFVVDSDGDGYFDKYTSPETQFIVDKYQDGKLYMKGKSNMGVGKKQAEVLTFVFEPANESDWIFDGITAVKKSINYDVAKGKYQRLSYNNELLENLFLVDAESRVILYKYMGTTVDALSTLPFYITNKGFTLVEPLKLDKVGTIQNFEVNTTTNTIVCVENPQLSLVYTDKESAVKRTPFTIFNKMYLGIEVYHSTGDPIGRNLKKVFDDLRPPYAPQEQHLNVIYFANNIDKDMGKTPFKYAQELTLIYADTDPSYSDKDLYGTNPTFVRIPVSYENSSNRMWVISLVGSVEQAFIDAYPTKVEYAKQKAKDAMPMMYRLLNENGWGLYAQAMNTNNPTVKVIDEEDIVGSFFTLYPYTVEDVNR